MHGSRDHGEGFGFHWRWPTGLFSPPLLSFAFPGAGRMRLRGCYEGTFSRFLLRSLDACRGGTAKRLEMQLRTALWGENHCQPRQETPSSAEREFGTEKHAQCKKKQTLNKHIFACACHIQISLCIRHDGTRHSPPRNPSPERPTASVSTSDSNSLRRSVERLFKRPMAAKGGGALTSTASAATENTSKSASKQPDRTRRQASPWWVGSPLRLGCHGKVSDRCQVCVQPHGYLQRRVLSVLGRHTTRGPWSSRSGMHGAGNRLG